MHTLRFGTFIPPIHSNRENPTLCIDRDLQLIVHLDQLGFDEAWIGEHHSGGAEVIASPELLIVAAAARTRRIRLGTGVNSLPYHHPLTLADRWMQLHHMTRGRAMFGCGPGALASDAYMYGIPLDRLRPRMEEALACIVRLLRGETVTCRTDWFELNQARLQLRPYANQIIDLVTACVVSPSGPLAAGKNGTGMISLSATSAAAMGTAADTWRLAAETGARHGHTLQRADWRMVGLVHIAETREQARRDVEFGLMDWVRYFDTVGTLPMVPSDRRGDAVDHMIQSGRAVIGTPDDCLAQIDRLWRTSGGGFGCYLITDTNWAPFEAKLKSYELFARYVMPRIQAQNTLRDASEARVNANHGAFKTQNEAAIAQQFAKLASARADGGVLAPSDGQV